MKNILVLGNHGFAFGNMEPDCSFAGYRIVTESDDDALMALESDGMPVDLVIIDHAALDTDDACLLQYVRYVAPAVPVIVLSASESVETCLKALAFGAFEYLNKPVAAEELRRVAAMAIERYGAGSDRREAA